MDQEIINTITRDLTEIQEIIHSSEFPLRNLAKIKEAINRFKNYLDSLAKTHLSPRCKCEYNKACDILKEIVKPFYFLELFKKSADLTKIEEYEDLIKAIEACSEGLGESHPSSDLELEAG